MKNTVKKSINRLTLSIGVFCIIETGDPRVFNVLTVIFRGVPGKNFYNTKKVKILTIIR